MNQSSQSRVIPLSPPRRLVNELLHHARKVPTVPHRVQLNVGPIAEARNKTSNKPTWTVLFAKAFALIAQTRADLRRCYIPWPRPHLYEHPFSICGVLV